MALVGVELETLVSETDALTTRPSPCANYLAKSRCLQFIENAATFKVTPQCNTMCVFQLKHQRQLAAMIRKLVFLNTEFIEKQFI